MHETGHSGPVHSLLRHIYFFVFGWARSSLLQGFLCLSLSGGYYLVAEQGPLLVTVSAVAKHRLWDTRAPWLWLTGFVALRDVESLWIRDRARDSYVGRRILYH